MFDLRDLPQSFAAEALALSRHVVFAEQAGTLHTLEGDVHYQSGDAILTGEQGEQWPLAWPEFVSRYQPEAGVLMGEAGLYRKHARKVLAWVADAELTLPLSNERGFLYAKPGDVIVQYAAGDCAVVQADIFRASYRRV